MRNNFYIETYGCQMNVVDSEIVVAVLQKNGFHLTFETQNADIILVNTCSIRENAEQRVRGRIDLFKSFKKNNSKILVCVLGCMSQRLKEALLNDVDFVVGPDAYRNLPFLIENAKNGQKSIDVKLSKTEIYDDILPFRYEENKVSAFVSIMRGCDYMCAYCIVPFVRGRERSRNPQTILQEINELEKQNFKEVTILGQNVDKYNWNNEINFAQLLEKIAVSFPKMRIRFSTSYPSDMTDEVLLTMKNFSNICKSIHLPVQSGNSRVLNLMKRNYTREKYLERIAAIRNILPECSISTDIIAGFCSETDIEHAETISLMKIANFDAAFMFKYSERPNTFAARELKDDISDEIKSKRLTEIIELQNELSLQNNKNDVGKIFEVLIESTSKRSETEFLGRNSQNKAIIFSAPSHKIGDFVNVKILECTSATLKGEIV